MRFWFGYFKLTVGLVITTCQVTNPNMCFIYLCKDRYAIRIDHVRLTVDKLDPFVTKSDGKWYIGTQMNMKVQCPIFDPSLLTED